MKPNKAPRLVTPVGTLAFPYLTTTDTKYYALGEYRTKIAYDPADPAWAAFIAKLTELRDQLIAAEIAKDPKVKAFAVQPIGEAELDKEGNATGRFTITAKQRAVVVSKTKGELKFPIVIVDAKKQAWPAKGSPIYGGTKAKLSVDPMAYVFKKTTGLSLRLVGVQVIDLVTGGGANADAAGFGEEDGYTAPTESPAADAADDAVEGGETKNEQF